MGQWNARFGGWLKFRKNLTEQQELLLEEEQLQEGLWVLWIGCILISQVSDDCLVLGWGCGYQSDGQEAQHNCLKNSEIFFWLRLALFFTQFGITFLIFKMFFFTNQENVFHVA